MSDLMNQFLNGNLEVLNNLSKDDLDSLVEKLRDPKMCEQLDSLVEKLRDSKMFEQHVETEVIKNFSYLIRMVSIDSLLTIMEMMAAQLSAPAWCEELTPEKVRELNLTRFLNFPTSNGELVRDFFVSLFEIPEVVEAFANALERRQMR